MKGKNISFTIKKNKNYKNIFCANLIRIDKNNKILVLFLSIEKEKKKSLQ